ncbi:MAG: type II secretion system protein GspM, partial [Syntrophomonadaceae bacterium]|nr:type II secretion system protein GspM [Syntrophomonadaceae bacterium]
MNFNLSERDKRMLMVIGGIAIFLLLFFVIYKPFVAKAEALDAQNAELAAHLAILQDYYANLETYELGINDARREVRAQT